MKSRLPLLLFAALFAFTPARAETVTLSATADTYVDSTNRTYNYGASVEYYIGNRTGTVETNMLLYFDLSSIPSNATITTASCSLWCSTINNADGWLVRCRSLDSSWVEGTGNGAYANGGASWTNQGIGSGVGGVTIAANDSGWGTVATGTVPPAGGAWSTAAVDSEAISSTTDSTIVFESAGFVARLQDYITGTKTNFGFHLFGTSPTSSRRVVVLSRESATTARRPKLTVNYDLPGDSTLLKFVVTPPSAPLTDYPVRVRFAHRGVDLDLDNLVFFAADTTTPLYWCPDSTTTDTLWAWVKQSWSTSPENIFVTQQTGFQSYQNCDRVFIIYENFNNTWSTSSPVTDLTNWNCSVFDTTGPILIGNPAGADSVIREPSGIIRDWQESTAARRYKYFYTGELLANQADVNLRYTNNICMWAYTSALGQTWSKADTVRYDSSGTTKPLRIEDPDIFWMAHLNKWLMIAENHQASATYNVGLFLADSLDSPVWTFYGNIPLLAASTLGNPTNWLNKEQASPAFCFNPTGDTLWCIFEAFDGAGTSLSYTGLAASFNGTLGYAGDTLGLDWHLCDSTGVINDANPSPILPETVTIPDALLYTNGKYWAINHSSGVHLIYSGTSLRSLALQTTDSAQFADCMRWDSTDGNYLGALNFSASGNSDSVYLIRLRDYDPAAFATFQDDFTILTRASRLGSYNRFLGGEAFTQNGLLTLYPCQFMTGSLSLMSTDSFNTGVAVDLWMQNTNRGDGTPYFTIAIGNDSLQDYAGTGWNNPLANANWYRPTSTGGYSLYIHPTAARFYDDTVATAQRGVGSATTIDADGDTLNSLHKWEVKYTSEDSLLFSMAGVRKISAKDVTWNGSYKRLILSQGEEQSTNRGGVTRIDSLRVRKYTSADATATTGFLYLANLSTSLDWFQGNPFQQYPFNTKPHGR